MHPVPNLINQSQYQYLFLSLFHLLKGSYFPAATVQLRCVSFLLPLFAPLPGCLRSPPAHSHQTVLFSYWMDIQAIQKYEGAIGQCESHDNVSHDLVACVVCHMTMTVCHIKRLGFTVCKTAAHLIVFRVWSNSALMHMYLCVQCNPPVCKAANSPGPH